MISHARKMPLLAMTVLGLMALHSAPVEAQAPYWIRIHLNPDGSQNCKPYSNCHPLYHTCCSSANEE